MRATQKRGRVSLDTKTEVGYDTGEIFLDQNVPTLQVPVSDGRLALCARDLEVEVGQTRGDGHGHVDHLERAHGVSAHNNHYIQTESFNVSL